ncbi:MAG: DUF4397 domain-containing protein [Ferruginibacter sp.]
MKYKFLNKSGLFTILAASTLLFSSCEKEFAKPTVDSTPEAYVAVHNFALLAGTSSSVFVNGTQLSVAGSNVALAVGGSVLGPYIGVEPGDVTVGTRTAAGTANYATRTVNVAQTSYTSFFAFDTLTTTGTARMLALTNDMRPADTATTNIRFLHFSPNAGAVNVVLTRNLNQFGAATTGTIPLSNVPYIGATATPNETALSAFTNIPAGTYKVDVLSGTTVVLTVPALTLREGKNYSIVARGFAPPRPAIPAGQTLGATLILHNP